MHTTNDDNTDWKEVKRLVYMLVLPVTVILFGTVTKWWSVALVDAPDDVMLGFPLPYVCSGWHTSLSLQIFLAEALMDVTTYFVFTLSVVFVIHRFVKAIHIDKSIVIVLYLAGALILFFFAVIASNPDNIFYWRNPFEFKVLETGVRFYVTKI